MGVHIDQSRYPLVEIRFDLPVNDADIDAFADAVRGLAARKQPYASVFNTRGVSAIPAAHRRRIVALSKELEAESAKYVVVACLAFDSAIARGVVTAINWFSPPPFEQRFFGSVESARAYAIRRLGERGIVVPLPAVAEPVPGPMAR